MYTSCVIHTSIMLTLCELYFGAYCISCTCTLMCTVHVHCTCTVPVCISSLSPPNSLLYSFSLDGLFLSGERAPHPSPLRGRGRQVSLTKPSANSLFEDGDQEKSALTADSAAGLGSEEKPFMKKEGLNEASKKEEKKLERPVFPWQKARQSRSHSVGSIGGTTSQGPNLPAKELGKTGDHMTVPHDAALDQGSQLASVRGMLLQPQKQAQEQFPPRLQSPVGGTYGAAAIASSAKGSSVDEEKLKGQVKQLEEQVKELEAQLQAEKLQHSEVQV